MEKSGKNQSKENIISEQGLDEGNNNGVILCTLCQENNLIIGGTIFMHKAIH